MDAGKREGDEDQTAEIRGSDGAATGLPPLRQTISPPTTTTDERMDKRGNEIKTFASDHLPLLGLPLEPASHACCPSPSIIGTDSNRLVGKQEKEGIKRDRSETLT